MKRILILFILASFSMLLSTGLIWCEEFHVSNATELNSALIAAQTNGESDSILIAQGTYTGKFSHISEEGCDISLRGGYSADWSRRVINPSNTVLDGGNTSRVLWLQTNNGGGILIEGLTIQNGYNPGLGAGAFLATFSPANPENILVISTIIKDNSSGNDGGGIFARTETDTGTAGDVLFFKDIIQGNETGHDGGGVRTYSSSDSGSTGNIFFVNNVIVGNHAEVDAGGIMATVYTTSGSVGNIYFTNNTVTENSVETPGRYAGGIFMDGAAYTNIYNNIIWFNLASVGGDIYLGHSGSIYSVYNNNYSDIFSPAWTDFGDNIDQYPFFRGSSDYSLQSISPCIDEGINSISTLPSTDIIGYPRITDGDMDGILTVDMGAYEFSPIFYVFDGHDFDRDTDSDTAVFRPSNGRWYIRNIATYLWGTWGDIPANGDYNGDSTTDIAVWRPSNGRWYIKDVGSSTWGTLGDIPVPKDYNGDGTTDVAVWRPSNGKWYIQGMGSYSWGVAGDIPVPGDYDGDGTTDIAVWRPSNGKWFLRGLTGTTWGEAGDIPVPGDYNGDGQTDLAVWRPSNGRWYIFGMAGSSWGAAGDIPAPGDYDGDGITDIAVWRPSNGRWYVKGIGSYIWGTRGDIPLVR
jgi:hypothetical protein